jgi:copper chaperone
VKTEYIKLTGMSCGGCASKVTLALDAVPGVHDTQVSLSKGEAIVQYDENVTLLSQLRSAVIDAGYGVNDSNESQSKGCCCKSQTAAHPRIHSAQ